MFVKLIIFAWKQKRKACFRRSVDDDDDDHSSGSLNDYMASGRDVVFCGGIEYRPYGCERHLHDIMDLVRRDLSEPYSIYTYRYFIYNWPNLCFRVSMQRIISCCKEWKVMLLQFWFLVVGSVAVIFFGKNMVWVSVSYCQLGHLSCLEHLLPAGISSGMAITASFPQ